MYAITIMEKETINLKENKVAYMERLEGGTERHRLLKKM